MKFHHVPIMVKEIVAFLDPKPGQTIIDATAGGGGHLSALKKACPTCQFIAIDQDEEAIKTLETRFRDITVVHDNFRNIVLVLKKLDIQKVGAIVLDLGVSTHQLETDYRGFSFNTDAPLDMRMDNRKPLSAATIVNQWPEHKLKEIFERLGQDPYSRSIARVIVRQRQLGPIVTTNQLVEVIKQATPPRYRYSREKIHFATHTFRALRMAVNNELGALESFLIQVPQIIKPGGKVAIITFHSLEDRLVKQAMQSWQGVATSVKPSAQEIVRNPKARSARLRMFVF